MGSMVFSIIHYGALPTVGIYIGQDDDDASMYSKYSKRTHVVFWFRRPGVIHSFLNGKAAYSLRELIQRYEAAERWFA